MKRPKFAHKTPGTDAAEPFDNAEEAHLHPDRLVRRRHRPTSATDWNNTGTNTRGTAASSGFGHARSARVQGRV